MRRPKNWKVVRILIKAEGFLRMKKYESAMKHYFEVVSLEPENVLALERIAHIYLRQSRHNKSLEYCYKIIAIKPCANIYSNIAITYRRLGCYDLAIKYFDMALELCPSNYLVYYNCAWMYIDQYGYNAAFELLLKAFKLDPKDESFFHMIAMIKYMDHQEEAALYLRELKSELQNLESKYLDEINEIFSRFKCMNEIERFEIKNLLKDGIVYN